MWRCLNKKRPGACGKKSQGLRQQWTCSGQDISSSSRWLRLPDKQVNSHETRNYVLRLTEASSVQTLAVKECKLPP